jgi:hypothetical protein
MTTTFQCLVQNEDHSLLVPTFGTTPRKMINGHANESADKQANYSPPSDHPGKLSNSIAQTGSRRLALRVG